MSVPLGVSPRLMRGLIVCAAAFGAPTGAERVIAQENRSVLPAGPPVLFFAPLPDVSGKRLVVVELTLPKRGERPPTAHRHPGSVYVYVTKGTARLGIEGQPVQEVRVGESFFEPPGALHSVMESASATEPASAIAVMIVPEGAPLVIPDSR